MNLCLFLGSGFFVILILFLPSLSATYTNNFHGSSSFNDEAPHVMFSNFGENFWDEPFVLAESPTYVEENELIHQSPLRFNCPEGWGDTIEIAETRHDLRKDDGIMTHASKTLALAVPLSSPSPFQKNPFGSLEAKDAGLTQDWYDGAAFYGKFNADVEFQCLAGEKQLEQFENFFINHPEAHDNLSPNINPSLIGSLDMVFDTVQKTSHVQYPDLASSSPARETSISKGLPQFSKFETGASKDIEFEREKRRKLGRVSPSTSLTRPTAHDFHRGVLSVPLVNEKIENELEPVRRQKRKADNSEEDFQLKDGSIRKDDSKGVSDRYLSKIERFPKEDLDMFKRLSHEAVREYSEIFSRSDLSDGSNNFLEGFLLHYRHKRSQGRLFGSEKRKNNVAIIHSHWSQQELKSLGFVTEVEDFLRTLGLGGTFGPEKRNENLRNYMMRFLSDIFFLVRLTHIPVNPSVLNLSREMIKSEISAQQKEMWTFMKETLGQFEFLQVSTTHFPDDRRQIVSSTDALAIWLHKFKMTSGYPEISRRLKWNFWILERTKKHAAPTHLSTDDLNTMEHFKFFLNDLTIYLETLFNTGEETVDEFSEVQLEYLKSMFKKNLE